MNGKHLSIRSSWHAPACVFACAFAVLSGPAAADPTTGPAGAHRAKYVAKRLVRPAVTPRLLCICVTIPVVATVSVDENLASEREYDLDLIAHGLEPIFGTLPSPTLTARDPPA